MAELEKRIQDRLKEIRAEAQRLEKAKSALEMDGAATGGRRRGRRSATTSQDGSRTRRRRRQRQRMDASEREAQALHAIRNAGSDGVSITDLAKQLGISRPHLYSRILPALDAQISRSRGRVAAR